MKKTLLIVVGLLCLAYAGNARVVKTGRDLEARQLTGNLIGNVTGDVTGSAGSSTGNAATATALASNPTDCSANQFAQSIATSGDLTCSAVDTSVISAGVFNSSYIPATLDTSKINSGAFTAARIASNIINTAKLETVTSGGTAPLMCATSDGKIGKCTANVDTGVTCTCAAF